MFDMAPIQLYHAFKATTAFVLFDTGFDHMKVVCFSQGTVATFCKCGGQICNPLM